MSDLKDMPEGEVVNRMIAHMEKLAESLYSEEWSYRSGDAFAYAAGACETYRVKTILEVYQVVDMLVRRAEANGDDGLANRFQEIPPSLDEFLGFDTEGEF